MKKVLYIATIACIVAFTSCKEKVDFTNCKAHLKNCPASEVHCPEHSDCTAHKKCAIEKDCKEHPNCEAFEHR